MRLFIAGLLAAVTGLANAQSSPSALSVLQKVMNLDAKTTYTAVRLQSNWDSLTTLKVRRDQSNTGANAVLVLSPLEKQGELSVDNARSWVQFFPDRAVLIVQDSPLKRRTQADINTRFELLKRNYRVSQDKAETIAGRKCQRISVVPSQKELLFTRRFWVDSEKFVVLRVQWLDNSGKSKTVSDTISISYPNSLPPETFEVRIGTSPKEIQIQAPVRQPGLNYLSRKVGFRVLQPSNMPLGFFLTAADSLTANNRDLAALRYTDGATNVTVYQAKVNPQNPPWTPSRSRGDFEMDGVLVAVEGDLPIQGRDMILKALRDNDGKSEASLRDRAASLLEVPADVIVTLRGYGFGYNDVIAAVLSAHPGTRNLSQSVSILKQGKSISELARLSKVPEADIKKTIAKFWSARQ